MNDVIAQPRHPSVVYDKDAEVCPHCAMTYGNFRTGLTFAEVRSMYWVTDDDSSTWKYKRRNTVLGKWREIKLNMWDEHLYICAAHAMFDGTTPTGVDSPDDLDDVPF